MGSSLESSRTGGQGSGTELTHALQVPWGFRGGVCGGLQDSLYQGLQVRPVWASTNNQLFLDSYDGAGPDAYFYAGERGQPSGNGIHIADDKGTLDILTSYRNEDIVLTLPGGKTLRTIRWLSVWCDAFGVNFGEVRIPRQLRYPRPQKIRAFDGIHDVESDK